MGYGIVVGGSRQSGEDEHKYGQHEQAWHKKYDRSTHHISACHKSSWDISTRNIRWHDINMCNICMPKWSMSHLKRVSVQLTKTNRWSIKIKTHCNDYISCFDMMNQNIQKYQNVLIVRWNLVSLKRFMVDSSDNFD